MEKKRPTRVRTRNYNIYKRNFLYISVKNISLIHYLQFVNIYIYNKRALNREIFIYFVKNYIFLKKTVYKENFLCYNIVVIKIRYKKQGVLENEEDLRRKNKRRLFS